MTDTTNRALPPPNNWQDFEALCFDLYSRIWRTNDAEMHGRRGQPQAGVDIYGTDRVENKFVGVQCKAKDESYGAFLTKARLYDEIEKAKTFQPRLDVFVVATTAPNDSAIQTVAREITTEHRKLDLFEVRIQAWGTLRQRITDYPDLLTKHFADFAPVEILARFEETMAVTRDEGATTRTAVEHNHAQIMSSLQEVIAASDPLGTKILELSRLTDDGSPQAALRSLTRLQDSEGRSASARNRYRLLANIGKAHLVLGDTGRAVEYFRAAYAADPEWPNAQAILATAELLEGNHQSAFNRAQRALRDDPSSHQAAAVILDAAPSDVTLAELEAHLSPDVRRRVDVILGLSIRARKTGDHPAAAAYARAAYAADPENWRTNAELAATLLAPLGQLEGISMTRDIPADLKGDVGQALSRLRKAWSCLQSMDSQTQGAHVAANLITALALVGLDVEADRVLDQALRSAPDYPPLLRRYAEKMIQADDWMAAAEALSKIPEERLSFEDHLLRIQTRIHSGRTGRCS